MRSYDIAVIPGDGIGNEVTPAALEVLAAAGRRHGFELRRTDYDWGCDRYVADAAMMPADALDQLGESDAIFLGAVGRHDVPDHVSLWGLLIPIRRHFRQYVNERPMRLWPGIESPLRGATPENLDLVVVRENNEGEYSEIGGRLHSGTDMEMAVQETVFTRTGCDRVMDYACRLAAERSGRICSATKSNGIIHTMPYWDERFAAALDRNPGLRSEQVLIDALAAMVVLDPGRFDVIVASNLFGDILSDLTAATAGSIGIAPSANLNPERDFPSMFEPVHGSAPDIAGKGVANPLGAIWSGAQMLEHLGEAEAAAAVLNAIEGSLAGGGPRTPDLGGSAGTADVVAELCAAF
ncbi:tartrate dehydrogenase [Thermoleophilia bacterium SCSIO 60948]|nr:tartrate dehydrogenase [Thermoleophilia bacterium SCSIO 60948]